MVIVIRGYSRKSGHAYDFSEKGLKKMLKKGKIFEIWTKMYKIWKSFEKGQVMILMKIAVIIIGTKIVFRKSSPYYNPYKSSGNNKAKHYFRHSLQGSVLMASLSSEYFSNSFLFIKGLMGLFCQSM